MHSHTGASALWVACINGHVNTAHSLLSRGARVDSADDARSTPLHAACSAGHDEMARLLLEKGASFDARDGARGFTSLMNACEAGHGECVRVLLEAGADPFDKISVPDRGRGRAGKNKLGDAYSCAFRSGHRELKFCELCPSMLHLRMPLMPSPQKREGSRSFRLHRALTSLKGVAKPRSQRGQHPCEIARRKSE